MKARRSANCSKPCKARRTKDKEYKMGFGKFKIIPLLVFVAMLSFSVRLVEVTAGVSSLPGTANAEEKTQEEDNAKTAAAEEETDHAEESDEKNLESDEIDTPPDTKEEKESEDIKWRDPTDEDPGYAAVKMEVFREFSERRRMLDIREKKLTTREAYLQAAERELERKYQELKTLRAEIENLLKKQSKEEQDRIESLIKVYEGMKPKDAARIFDTLDLDVLVSVVSGMSERKLSPILANMNPERARTITIMLAEQKTLPDLPQSN